MTRLLTETADYNVPGSWGTASEGWPGVRGDEAYDMYVFANCAPSIPYGSYVLMSKKGEYGGAESYLRVHVQYLDQLLTDFEAAGKPSAEESIRRRSGRPKADRWWP